MLDFINQLGIFGLLLVILFLANLFLTVKYSIKLFGEKAENNIDINKIIFIGIFGLAVGVFSHFLGLYEASKIFAHLESTQIAQGYGQSLLALLFGFIIFFISGISWFSLRIKVKKI